MRSPDFSNKRTETHLKTSPNMLVRIGAVVLASFVTAAYIEGTRGHGHVNQSEIVQPYDTAWDLVRRADKDAGIDPDNVDMRPAVDRVVDQYGTNLQPGQKIVVNLDK